LTLFYADLLLRRANLPTAEGSRIEHLQHRINSYFNSAGNYRVSPEKVSLAEYAPWGMLGDYMGNTHLQGELIGTLLDLHIRKATGNKKNIDDLMRWMMIHYGGRIGFEVRDIQRGAEQLCNCSLQSFFKEYISGKKPLPFNDYLSQLGYSMQLQWKDATDEQGNKVPDMRIWAWQKNNAGPVRASVNDPTGIWANAGLHTGDYILSVNGQPVLTGRNFYDIINTAKYGDTLKLTTSTKNGRKSFPVHFTGYKKAEVKLVPFVRPTLQQQQNLQSWNSAQ
jgi:predicted metalloprotease with PDZ domain